MTTITRPLNKAILDPNSGQLSLEWDKFFNDVQVALNNLENVSTFQLSAAASTTVSDRRVTSSSVIAFIPANAAAATLEGSARKLYVSARTAGVSFTVSTASGASAAGTEIFAYTIIG